MKKIAIPIETTELCSYGCGQIAKFMNGSKKLKCHESTGQCPVIKQNNSEKTKKLHESGKYKNCKDRSWNRGLTKETDERVRKNSEAVKEAYRNDTVDQSYRLTESYKNKMSEHAKKHGFGGITQSRWIRYNGKMLGSSYELKVAKTLDENNIKWDTCSRFKYVDPFGKQRTYTPDFYLPEYEIFLDPKNDFLIEQINPNLGFKDVEKIKLVENQNNIKVLILSKDELEWYIILNKIMGCRQRLEGCASL